MTKPHFQRRSLTGLILLVFSTAVFASDVVPFGNWSWAVPNAADWKVDTSQASPVLQLLVGREPPSNLPRRPMQFAVLQGKSFSSVTIECDVMPLGRSVMIVYGYTDGAHFDYAHLSTDTGIKQPHHNGIFKVDGGERQRISDTAGPAAFPENNRWYHVTVHRDHQSGAVDVQVDGKMIPALHATNKSLKAGQIGIGSFDETGKFRNVQVTGAFAPQNNF